MNNKQSLRCVILEVARLFDVDIEITLCAKIDDQMARELIQDIIDVSKSKDIKFASGTGIGIDWSPF